MVKVDELLLLCQMLVKRTDSLVVYADAMRFLLEKHGVFSAEEFEAVRKQMTAEYRQDVARRLEGAENEAIRQLLESFEGPKQ